MLRASRWRRVLAIALLAAMLAPGLWWRDPPRQIVNAQTLTAVDLQMGEIAFDTPGLRPLGAWRLNSPNSRFGGYSALVALSERRLLAFSDTGHALTFADPQDATTSVRFHPLSADYQAKSSVDIEAATRDPATGTIWIASEGANSIRRSRDSLEAEVTIRPEAMEDWPSNQGPEAMARLKDGRFIVLSEGDGEFGSSGGPGLLFPGDPLEGVGPVRFRFAPPEGFRATDAAVLPDGRVLILLRRLNFTLPLSFDAKLVIADPAEISPGELWPWEEVADIAPPLPSDNYEGLAVAPQPDGSVVLWLMSDDNGAVFQRTLLLKLSWRVPPRSNAERRASSARAPRDD